MKKLLPLSPLLLLCSSWLVLFTGCGGAKEEKIAEGETAPVAENMPDPPREFRAAWIATVDNIDWPSAPGLPVEKQQQEAVAILNKIRSLNMNAVIFQVRPHADALYRSELEPWSWYLTGKQGTGPTPDYDPLEFWIAEAHKRGLQFHAWFNPFRANHKAHKGEISDQSVIKQKPELVVKLGDEGYWWMDPAQEESRQHSTAVILDVVKRYNIDGVHFDDYFYPYPSYNGNKPFPDETSYSAYQEKGGTMAQADWRRHAVNRFVSEIGPLIKKQKSHVQFGISPFGIWRPNNPPGVSGMDQYNVLFADSRLWIREGWVDYLMPQLYWPVDAPQQNFSALLTWWNGQNLKKRHVWPGLKIAGLNGPQGATELLNQITITRNFPSTSKGVCLFSMRSLMDPEMPAAQALVDTPWKEAALPPATPWIDAEAPQAPSVDLYRTGDGTLLTRFQSSGADVFQFVINEKQDGSYKPAKIVPGMFRSFQVGEKVSSVAVRCVDRLGNLSEPSVVKIPGRKN